MSKKIIFYIFFFVALVLGFYYTLAAVIPGFTKPKFPPVSKVEPWQFTNQDGDKISDTTLNGKITVVNFFFTTCKSVCPRMNNNLRPVYDAYLNEPKVQLISYTSDPETDSASRLKAYADSMKLDTHKWMFLTGRKDSLYATARNSYTLDDQNNNVVNINDQFLHTQFIALVNPRKEVIRIYDGLKPSEMNKLKDDIAALLKD